MSTVNLNYLLE